MWGASLTQSVVVVPRGGLGNQLFTVTAGLLAAAGRGRQVRIDMSQAGHEEASGFFPLQRLVPLVSGNLVADTQPASWKWTKQWSSLSRYLASSHPLWERLLKVYVEESGGFDPDFLQVRNRRRVFGYFQSYRYVEELEKRQGVLAVCNRSPTRLFKRLEGEMRSAMPITVHIRRGDYRSHPVFGTLSLNYYAQAVQVLKQYVGQRPVWVFSDDSEFVRRNFMVADRVIGAELDAAETLILMSKGTGIAIANSSLSWWAAWLSREPNHVTAPVPWFRGKAVDVDALIPHRWHRIAAEFSTN